MKKQIIWTTETLGDIDPKLSTGGTPRRDNPEFWKKCNIPWVKVSDTHEKIIHKTEESINEKALLESNAKKFPKGSVIMSIIGTIGNVSLLGIDAAISQSVIGINPDKKKILSEYLVYYIDFQKNQINDESQKGTHKNMNTPMVKNIKIRYTPLPIQQKIVNVLNQITLLKEKRKQSLEWGRQLLLSSFLTFFGEPAINSQKWDSCIIKDVMQKKLQNGLYKHDKFYGKGTKIAWVENISDSSNELIVNDLKMVQLDQNEMKFLLNKNDVLITRSSHLGKRGVGVMNVFDNHEDVCFESHIMRLVLNLTEINPYYLCTYFKTRFARENLYVKHGNMASIDQPEIEKILILLPPIKLQNDFAKIAIKIQDMLTKQIFSEETLKRLELSVYDEFFITS